MGKYRKENIRRQGIASFVLTGSMVAALGGCGGLGPQAPLEVVDGVELGRYTGRWYEIARYPNSFERGCFGVTADYALRTDGNISVVNTCREQSPGGDVETIVGTARVVDPTTNAKLAVTFFGPFEGPYWILELGEEYDYAVVGGPDRDLLWILSREPTLDEELYEDILSRLPEKGYDPDRLEQVQQ